MNRPRDDAGFTLIEVVMVIVIATVAMFPLASMFANATVDSVKPELVTQGVFLAQERIETVLADYNTPTRGYDYVIAGNYPVQGAIAGMPGFSVAVAISSDSTYSSITFKQIAVTATHPAITPVTLRTWVTK